MSLLHPLELMIVSVVAIALLGLRLPAAHQPPWLNITTLPPNGDITENVLKVVPFLIASAAASIALWAAN